jgi:RNA 2',3'-cyclic 3'-phosphodiesterase
MGGQNGSPAGRTVRLFFALWPDDAARAALGRLAQALHRECGGRAMATRNIHLTLVFLGNVEADCVPGLRAIADAIIAPRFELVVDRIGYWRHNRLAWAGPQACPDALRALVADLEGSLKKSGFHCDERAYAAHITLLRDVHSAPAMRTVAAIPWRIADFALVQSLRRDNSTVYEPLQRWPLAAG